MRILGGFIFSLLMVVIALAGAPKIVTIDDFSLGLNTVKTVRQLLPGEAPVAHNVDLEHGTLKPRDGYDSLFTVAGQDSFLWNQPIVIPYSDGSKEMVLVSDSAGVGYANIYRTTKNTINLGTTDTFFIAPDTARAHFLADSIGTDTVWWFIGIGNDGANEDLIDFLLPVGATPATILDSFLAHFNVSGSAASFSMVDMVDSVRLVENASDLHKSFDTTLTYLVDTLTFTQHGGFDTWRVRVSSSLMPNRIATYVPATGTPQAATFQDKTYIVNGVGRGLVYDGRNTQPFPLQASGEVLAVPLTTAGTMDGRYRYCLRQVGDSVIHSDTTIANRWGYLSQPVIVDSGNILLYGFPRRTYDWHSASKDSITYEIWRTVGSVGLLDKLDSVWNTGMTVSVDSSNYTTITVTDTMSDVTLRTKAGQVYVSSNLYGWSHQTEGTGVFKYYRRPGAVGFIANDSVASGKGIWQNGTDTASYVSFSTCAGYSVIAVAVDTALGIIGDSSVGFNFHLTRETGTYGTAVEDFDRVATECMRYTLPRPYNPSVVYFVYRGPIEILPTDSSFWQGEVGWVIIGADFFVPHYYFIGQYNAGDTVSDSVRYDQLISSAPYTRNAIPAIANAVTAFNNRLFMADGSFIQYSTDVDADSNTSFLTFNRVPINPDDGDQITAMWPQKGVLRVAKTQSIYNVYENSEGEYQSMELTNHYGAISSFSHTDAPEGDYYLSTDGVRLEDEGIYKERSFIGTRMSSQLVNFTKLPFGTLRQSVAAPYYDNKYMLCFPSIDTTFVLHKITKPDGSYQYAWATSSLEFSGAALYAVSSSNDFIPSDSLYFTKPGKSSLYRFGSSRLDNGVRKTVAWKGLLNVPDGIDYQVNTIRIGLTSDDTTQGLYRFWLYNHQDSIKGSPVAETEAYTMPRSDTASIISWELRPTRESPYWMLYIASQNVLPQGDFEIDAITIELISRGGNRLR